MRRLATVIKSQTSPPNRPKRVPTARRGWLGSPSDFVRGSNQAGGAFSEHQALRSTTSYSCRCGAKPVSRLRERVALWGRHGVAETDNDYEAAAAEFSDKELADLTYAIGFMNVFNRLGISFRTPPAAAKA